MNLDIAISEMEGRNRLRAEFETPYKTAREALRNIHLQIGNEELPEIYAILIQSLDEKMMQAKNKRNSIISISQENSSVLPLAQQVHPANDNRVYNRGVN